MSRRCYPRHMENPSDLAQPPHQPKIYLHTYPIVIMSAKPIEEEPNWGEKFGWVRLRKRPMEDLRDYIHDHERIFHRVNSNSTFHSKRLVYIIGENHVEDRARRKRLEDAFLPLSPRSGGTDEWGYAQQSRLLVFQELALTSDSGIGLEDPIISYLSTFLTHYTHVLAERLGETLVVPKEPETLGRFRLPPGYTQTRQLARLFEEAPALAALMKNVNTNNKNFTPYSLDKIFRIRPYVPAGLFDQVLSVAKMVDDNIVTPKEQHVAWNAAFEAVKKYRDQGMARRMLVASQKTTSHAPFVLITGQTHVRSMTELLTGYGFRVTAFDRNVPADTIIPQVLRRANWLFVVDRAITLKRKTKAALDRSIDRPWTTEFSRGDPGTKLLQADLFRGLEPGPSRKSKLPKTLFLRGLAF